MDAQHQRLFEQVNRLAQLLPGVTQGELGTDAVVAVLDELCDIAREHFAHEEALMQAAQYDGLAEHTREHLMLVAELRSIVGAIKSGRHTLDQHTLTELRQWLIVHNRYNEQAFADACLDALGDELAEVEEGSS